MADAMKSQDNARIQRHNKLKHLVDDVLAEDRMIDKLDNTLPSSASMRAGALQRIKTQESVIFELVKKSAVNRTQTFGESDFLHRARLAAMDCPSIGVNAPMKSVKVPAEHEQLYLVYAKARDFVGWANGCEYLIVRGDTTLHAQSSIDAGIAELQDEYGVMKQVAIHNPVIGLQACTLTQETTNGSIEMWVEHRLRPITYG